MMNTDERLTQLRQERTAIDKHWQEGFERADQITKEINSILLATVIEGRVLEGTIWLLERGGSLWIPAGRVPDALLELVGDPYHGHFRMENGLTFSLSDDDFYLRSENIEEDYAIMRFAAEHGMIVDATRVYAAIERDKERWMEDQATTDARMVMYNAHKTENKDADKDAG